MKSVEQLFPQFQMINILRQNSYKKSIIVKRSGHNYMLRVFALEGIPKDRVQSIIKTLNKISSEKSENMLKFYEASFDQEMTYLGIISEFLEKQFSYPIKENDLWTIIQQLSGALQLFHPNKVHGKLQLSNIFQSKGRAILGEMNVLFQLHKQNYQDIYLLAPEFIRNQVYDCKSDVWMFGYMLYQMMFKDPPIIANNVDVMHKKILKGIQLTYNPNYSLNMNNLLRLMLCYDPELRPTVEQITYYCQQAQLSNEEININKILPKFKVDKVVLHKKRTEKRSEPVQNVVYLSEDHYRQPYFPPSKVKKQKRMFLSKQVTSIFDIPSNGKTTYSLQLPKVLNYQFSKLKIKEAGTMPGSLGSREQLERYQVQQFSLNHKSQVTKLEFDNLVPISKPNLQTQRKSPPRLLLQQELQNKQKSQRLFF